MASFVAGYLNYANGENSVAAGERSIAAKDNSMVTGRGITCNRTQSFAVSGYVFAEKFVVQADARLTAELDPANVTEMLQRVRGLQVVEHRRSDNHCRHLGLTLEACATDRSVGFVAQQVASAAPHVVRSGVDMQLMATGSASDATERLEQVEDVKMIDVQAMLGMLVGAQQAHLQQTAELRKQLEEQDTLIARQAEWQEEQKREIAQLRKQNEVILAQMAVLMKQQMLQYS